MHLNKQPLWKLFSTQTPELLGKGGNISDTCHAMLWISFDKWWITFYAVSKVPDNMHHSRFTIIFNTCL